MRKIAVITNNKEPQKSSWSAVADPKEYFNYKSFSVEKFSQFDPDFTIVHAHAPINNTIKNLLSGKKSIYLYTDYRKKPPDWVVEFAKVCTALGVVHQDKELWNYYEKKCGQKNIYFIDIGANTNIYYPIKTKKKYDILFSANFYGVESKKRVEFVEKLRQHFNDKFYLIGSGWHKKYEPMKWVPHRQLNTIVNESKITVGMSAYTDVSYYTSARLFQQMATGVPHIAWESPNVSKLFNQGYLEIDNYKDFFDLIEKLLKDPEIRAKIGMRQYKEIIDRHSQHNLWEQIKDIMEKI